MTKRKRQYNQEFKEESVKLVLEHRYTISETAKNLGVHPNLLGLWKRELIKQLLFCKFVPLLSLNPTVNFRSSTAG